MTAVEVQRASNVETVRHYFEVMLNKRDANTLTPVWHEDVVAELPTGTIRGRDALRDYFASTFAAAPDFHIEAKSIVGDGDKVLVRWHIRATFSGAPWMGIEPPAKPIELDGVDCFTMRDGRVLHNFVIYDQMSFARQIGMMPPQDSPLERAMIGAFNMRTRLRKMATGH